MPRQVLLLGRTGIVFDDIEAALDSKGLTLHAGTSLDDVETVMANNPVDTVIMGAGIDINTRLAIIRHIFDVSSSTTVHMKDWDSGPAGMLPFVRGVLTGVRS